MRKHLDIFGRYLRAGKVELIAVGLAAVLLMPLPVCAQIDPPQGQAGADNGTAAEMPSSQQVKHHFIRFNHVEDVLPETTLSPAKIHLYGDFQLWIGDYFRGEYGGAKEGQLSPVLALGSAVNLYEGNGAIRGLDFSLGVWNGWNTDPPSGLDNPESWFASQWYTGLAMNVADDWVAGLVYAYYQSPSRIFPNYDEFGFQLKYIGSAPIGWLNPWGKIVVPLEERDGVFLAFGIEPGSTVNRDSHYPITISLPMELGIGFSDFYEGRDVTAYFQPGIKASIPLKSISSDYGNWSLAASVNGLFRGDRLQDLGEPYDNAGNAAVWGWVGVSFIY